MSRLPLILGVLAGMACGIALSLTRPAAADATVNAPIRYDVQAACAGFSDQLEDELQHFWQREQLFGDVQLQFSLANGRIADVKTRGRFGRLNTAVRTAVQRVNCGPSLAGEQVFQLHVAFIDPDRTSRAEAMAHAPARIVVADLKP